MIRGPEKTVSVLMPLDLYEQLKALSNDADRPLSRYIRQVLKSYLWHLENRPEMMAEWRTVRKFPGEGQE